MITSTNSLLCIFHVEFPFYFTVLIIIFCFKDIVFVLTTFILNLSPKREILPVIPLSYVNVILYCFHYFILLFVYYVDVLACLILLFKFFL